MKKAVLVFASIFIIGFAAFCFYLPPASLVSNQSNNEEYYYNKNSSGGTDQMQEADHYNTIGVGNTREKQSESMQLLVNKDFGLPEDYVPEDLIVPDVIFSFSGYNDKKLLREKAAHALEDLFAEAKKAGLNLYGVSGYRSYKRQKEIFDNSVLKNGMDHAEKYSARAGCSEHQTGLSMDVSTLSIHNRLDETFAATPEGKWLAEHAYEYGFIIRYPKDKSDITGYAYEPWHIRYVGMDLAKTLHDKNLTLEEYYGYTPSNSVFQNDAYGTSIDVDGEDYSATE